MPGPQQPPGPDSKGFLQEIEETRRGQDVLLEGRRQHVER